GSTGGMGRARSGRLLPADPSDDPRPQGHDQSLADETDSAAGTAGRGARATIGQRAIASARARRQERVMRRLLIALLAVLLAGCAGVPSTSAPQAIGTIE